MRSHESAANGRHQLATMIGLSEATSKKINALFAEPLREEVEELLKTECGDNIPFCENCDMYEMERIRFSVLKLSEGNLDQLIEAIILAQTDWRDLFMAAGFGYDTEAHKKWVP